MEILKEIADGIVEGAVGKQKRDCEFSDKCPIATIDDSEWRRNLSKTYCHGNPNKCRRREIRREHGLQAVPVTLLPDGTHHTKSVFQKDTE